MKHVFDFISAVTLRWKKTMAHLFSTSGEKWLDVQQRKKNTTPLQIKKLKKHWLAWIFIILLALILLAVGSLFYILRDLPSPRSLGTGENFPVSSQIFDRNGVLLY